jgi:hypothetical protein
VKAVKRGTFVREREAPAAVAEAPQSTAEAQCVHHWVIDSPAGSTSTGVCRVCGERRVFSNYVSDFIFEGDSAESLQPGAWKKPVTELVRPEGGEKDDSSFASGVAGSYSM